MMTGTVVILGAKGRFGRAATTAFVNAGWHTKALARSWEETTSHNGAKRITADVANHKSLLREVRGSDVIINAVNPSYHMWAEEMPKLTQNVIRVAAATGATVMIPGNVYNYGAGMPKTLHENTPHIPSGPLGQLREEMEQSYRAAAESDGTQTIILRGGDFLEGVRTGNWFDSHIANKVHKGIMTYPGPLDRMHAWAYLPDMARALVMLANKRSKLPTFSEFGYEGYNLTGAELISAAEQAAGHMMKVRKMPWHTIRLLQYFMPTLRGVVEMSYLWHTPHQVDGSKLKSSLPDFAPTPLADAMHSMLKELSAYTR